MKQLRALGQLLGGHALDEEDDGPARRIQVVLVAVLASALLCAAFGFALGGASIGNGVANIVKAPLVIILPSVVSLPVALLAWRFTGTSGRATDLVVAAGAGLFSAATVLAVLAPVVAIYYHTSESLGPTFGLGVGGIAYLVGTAVSWRAALGRSDGSRLRIAGPLVVMTVVHAATLLQLISISSLMEESTFLDDGLEGFSTSVEAPR